MNTQSMCFSRLARSVLMMSVLVFAMSYIPIANAAQGCGFGYHRGAYGGCWINRPAVGSTPAPMHPGCWRTAWGALRCYR